MSWFRRMLAHLALSRTDASLVHASGGEPRTVRGMTLDPRLQFLEAQSRLRQVDWDTLSPQQARAGFAQLVALFGGSGVAGVRAEKIYVTGRSHSVPCRLYLPTVRDNKAAMLLYFHSGGGVIGNLECCHRLAAMVSKAAGAPVLSVDYRLAPEHKFPVGLDDARAAFAWALANAGRYGAPLRKVAVGGDSMGGNFAAVIALDGRDGRFAAPPVLQVLLYPVVDFVSDTASMHDFADAFPLTQPVCDYFQKQYFPEGVDMSDPRISPLREANLAGVAPALIYNAGFDMLLDQGEAYAQRLAEAGVRVQHARFDSLPHSFISFSTAAPAAQAAMRRMVEEIAAALKAA